MTGYDGYGYGRSIRGGTVDRDGGGDGGGEGGGTTVNYYKITVQL